MTAIRRDEDTDNLHSLYVDQWDWEVIISKKDRNVSTLKSIVKKVYEALRNTEVFINSRHPEIKCILPENIKFVTTQELLDRWPDKTAKERESAAAKEYGAIFLMQIGDKLSDEGGYFSDGDTTTAEIPLGGDTPPAFFKATIEE